MRPGFDLDGGTTAATGGAFFLCTETWPRCFVIKQVSDVDGALKEVQQQNQQQQHANDQQQQQQQQQQHANDQPLAVGKPSVATESGPTVAAATSSSPQQQQQQPEEACSSSSSAAPPPGASSSLSSPYLPMLPWWFTAECRQQLLAVPGPEDLHHRALTPENRPSSSIGGGAQSGPMSQEQLRARLTRQLEYYFSRENLINDRYLRCQMDADQYVPIKIVANFPKVAQLTTDFELIVDVLKSSAQVQVDETGTRVRPMSKRCTIILREIPENADEKEVKSMFQGDGCPPYQSLAYGLNDSWYVTFGTEEDTQQAFFHLQTLGKTFNGKPVFARIKTGGAPIGADLHHRHSPDGQIRLEGGSLRGQLIIHDPAFASSTTTAVGALCSERATPSPAQQQQQHQNGGEGGNSGQAAFEKSALGQLLAQFGYIPRATFRPHIPAPAPPVMPPLQPTTSLTGERSAAAIGGLLPQPTSYFAQPILHNGILNGHHQMMRFRHQHHQQLHHQLQHQQHRPAIPLPLQQQRLTNDGHPPPSLPATAASTTAAMLQRRPTQPLAITAPDEAAEHFANEVGQNELVLRQLARSGAAASPVLLPNPSGPRITDVPRMNGKGAPLPANSHQQPSSASGTKNNTLMGGRHSPLHTASGGGGGGGGFMGFQRQESVEAYQIALAANGVAKQQKRQSKAGVEEEPMAAGGTRGGGKFSMGSLPKSASSRTNSSDQPAPARILGSGGPRRSEPAAATANPPPLRPLHETAAAAAASNATSWRQPPAAGGPRLQSPPRQPTTATASTTTASASNGLVDHQFRGNNVHWQNGPANAQQQQQQPLTRAQPLLSLGQALSSLNHQVHLQQQQQTAQQHQQHHNSMQPLSPLSGTAGPGGGGRGPTNFDSRRVPRDSTFRGTGAANNYRPRTWTSDWTRGGSNNNNNQQQQQQQSPQQSASGGGGHFSGPRDSGSRGTAGSGSSGWHWPRGGGGGGGPGRVLARGKRAYEAGGIGRGGHSGQQETGSGGAIVEVELNGQQQQQQEGHKEVPHQQQQHRGGSRGSGLHRHDPIVAHRHEHNHQSLGQPTAARNAKSSNHQQHPHPTVVGGQRCRQHSGSAESQESGGAGGAQKQLGKAEKKQAGYNFEEHVEEFPALSLSQSNSRKASECHGDGQQAPPLLQQQLLAVPDPSCQQQSGSAAEKTVEKAAAEKPSSSSSITSAASNCENKMAVTSFSSVVASGRPRRATIGTTTATTPTATTLAAAQRRKGQTAAGGMEPEAGGEAAEEDEEVPMPKQQPRSGTIGGGVQLLLASGGGGGGGGQRSYAQMLKGGNGHSAAAKNVNGAGGSTKAENSSSCCSSTSMAGTEV